METQRNGDKLTIFAQGRIDTNTAPRFADEVLSKLDGVGELTVDFSRVEYVSSFGLRALMTIIKTMRRQGDVRVVNVSEGVYDVLETTGFTVLCDMEMRK